MDKNYKILRLPLVILTIIIVIRLFGLLQSPPSLFFDEESIIVNASLMAESGIDQYGSSYPFFFRALDDYKHPLFPYTVSATFKLLGPSPLNLRLVSAAFGLISIFALSLITWRIFDSGDLALWSAVILAASPWHFHFSRIGWQAISLVAIFYFAIYFLISWERTGKKNAAILCGIFLGLTLYTYSTAKLLAAFFAGIVLISAYILPQLKSQLKPFIVSLTIVSLPYVVQFLRYFDELSFRLKSISITPAESLSAYLSYFSPSYLFIHGDINLRHSDGAGSLEWYLAPLLLLSLYQLIKRKDFIAIVVFLLVCLSPILGSFTEGYPHTTRGIAFLQCLVLLSIFSLPPLLGKRSYRFIFAFFILFSFLARTVYYFHEYPDLSSSAWKVGRSNALSAAKVIRKENELVLSPHASYTNWLYISPPEPELILKHKSWLQDSYTKHDPFDIDGTYNFLPFRRMNFDPKIPGLWMTKKQFAKTLGINKNVWLYENDSYVVFRRVVSSQ